MNKYYGKVSPIYFITFISFAIIFLLTLSSNIKGFIYKDLLNVSIRVFIMLFSLFISVWLAKDMIKDIEENGDDEKCIIEKQ